ncbi:MAG: hypothetical protein E7I48_05545 [Clostridium celatum]|nr:hypothetical protein [Clostridium celatum]
MKNLKKLTREQKKVLQKEGLDPRGYLIERATIDEYRFYDLEKEEIISIRR